MKERWLIFGMNWISSKEYFFDWNLMMTKISSSPRHVTIDWKMKTEMRDSSDSFSLPLTGKVLMKGLIALLMRMGVDSHWRSYCLIYDSQSFPPYYLGDFDYASLANVSMNRRFVRGVGHVDIDGKSRLFSIGFHWLIEISMSLLKLKDRKSVV